ncbi:MAG: competence protein ComE [Chloroflexi bacterium]|nr:competence protein ComE [Chloroflexota bacterium]
MKNWGLIAIGVLFGLLGAGAVLIASSPPRGIPIDLLPPPTPVPIRVHISGAVAQPGVVALPPESRVQDAIAAAGGFSEDAQTENLNLAALLEDGSQVIVPIVASANNTPAVAESSPIIADPPQGESVAQIVNINTASQAELETLPGVGPVTAEKIIAYRQENGAFSIIEEIQNVSGIGPATFEKMKPLITVDP